MYENIPSQILTRMIMFMKKMQAFGMQNAALIIVSATSKDYNSPPLKKGGQGGFHDCGSLSPVFKSPLIPLFQRGKYGCHDDMAETMIKVQNAAAIGNGRQRAKRMPGLEKPGRILPGPEKRQENTDGR
jgi:hypothetical protein